MDLLHNSKAYLPRFVLGLDDIDTFSHLLFRYLTPLEVVDVGIIANGQLRGVNGFDAGRSIVGELHLGKACKGQDEGIGAIRGGQLAIAERQLQPGDTDALCGPICQGEDQIVIIGSPQAGDPGHQQTHDKQIHLSHFVVFA